MSGNSSPVLSSQQGCHEQLDALVQRHLARPSQRPPAPHTQEAFDRVQAQVVQRGAPIVLDSFCGTGMSTALLAQRFPDSIVIGVDKSAHRLGKHGERADEGYLLVQADCGDFWRLAAQAGWHVSQHYLLYPNPWPKSGQVKRRVHGSADFPALLTLGGDVELRSNWPVYVEEFAQALRVCGESPQVEKFSVTEPMTLHERKYLESGHELWRCQCKLVHNRAPARR